jgi:hypothetical protein
LDLELHLLSVLSTINQVINQGKGIFGLVNQSRLDVSQSIKANLLKALTSLGFQVT